VYFFLEHICTTIHTYIALSSNHLTIAYQHSTEIHFRVFVKACRLFIGFQNSYHQVCYLGSHLVMEAYSELPKY